MSRPPGDLAPASAPISCRQSPVSVSSALGLIFKNTSHVHKPLTDDILAYISTSSTASSLQFSLWIHEQQKPPSLLVRSLAVYSVPLCSAVSIS